MITKYLLFPYTYIYQYFFYYYHHRFLGFLKNFVKNKAHPESSIAEAYIVNESMTFCSMYLCDIETKFNHDGHINDETQEGQNNNGLSVFAQKACPFGGKSFLELSQQQHEAAHWYILNNCEELQPYLNEHFNQLKMESNANLLQRQQKHFPKWFKERMISLRHKRSIAATNELYALACGPDLRVRSYSGCDVNGVRYHTFDRDNRLTTQNNGIVVVGEHDYKEIEFYGVLVDVLELQYLFQNEVILFVCVSGLTQMLKGKKFKKILP